MHTWNSLEREKNYDLYQVFSQWKCGVEYKGNYSENKHYLDVYYISYNLKLKKNYCAHLYGLKLGLFWGHFLFDAYKLFSAWKMSLSWHVIWSLFWLHVPLIWSQV